MSILSVITGLALVVGASAGVLAATQAESATGIDIWILLEKGGAPLAGLLFLALAETDRRLQRCHKAIEAKDATILELSNRQMSAIQTITQIANDQMTIARSTETLLRELVTLLRGRLDVG